MAPPDGYIDPNFPNPNGPDDASIVIYGYTPNFALCILGVALFALLLTAHAFQVFRYRYWTFILMIVACIMEIIGYAFRVLSSKRDPYMVGYFVAQYFCITCAPVFISASVYIYLTELQAWAEYKGFQLQTFKKLSITSKKILWTFIVADIICTILQITGAAMIGSSESNGESPVTGNSILIGGLAVQVFAFLIFLVILLVLILSLFRTKEANLLEELQNKKIPAIALLIAGSFVILRTLFRLIESAQGVFGYLSTHEAFFGSLEFLPMVVASSLLAIWFPGRIFDERRTYKVKKPRRWNREKR